MGFLTTFIGATPYVRNSWLRSQMAEVLHVLLPEHFYQKHARRARALPQVASSLSSLYESSETVTAYLVPALLALYVDIENTGRHAQFYEKFNCFPVDHQVLTEFGFYSLDDIEAHFEKYDRLRIACPVGDAIEYHAIRRKDVTIATGKHRLISMGSTEVRRGSNNVSLTPTDNHRMWVRTGPTSGNRQFPVALRHSPFRIKTAQEVFELGQSDPTAVVQFQALCREGLHVGGAGDEVPPYWKPLGISTMEQDAAFLRLYGYFLGDGWLNARRKSISFGPCKTADWDWLDLIFEELKSVPALAGRIRVDPRPETTRGRGKAIVGVKQRGYHILGGPWWEYFAAEYLVKSVLRRKVLSGPGERELRDHVIAAPNAKRPRAEETCGPMKAEEDAGEIDVEEDGDEDKEDKFNEHGFGAEEAANEIEDVDSDKWLMMWALRLDRERARRVLEGLRFAVGDQATPHPAGGGHIGTSSVRFRDEVVHLALHAGYTVHYRVQTKKGKVTGVNQDGVPIVASRNHYDVSYAADQGAEPKLTIAEECEAVEYEGTVWCVTVPTAKQLIIVRRELERDENNEITRTSRPIVVGNTRYGMGEVLEYLWGIPKHRHVYHAIPHGNYIRDGSLRPAE